MKLIIIIAAILIERFWQGIKDHYRKNYFSQGVSKVLETLPEKVKDSSELLLCVLLVVPFLVVCLINLILSDIVAGLPAILFNIALLLLCVNSRPEEEQIQQFVAAQQDNDSEKVSEAFYEITGESIETVDRPNSYVTRSLLLQNLRRWFGVLFYFVLLGPAAVVLYRTLQDLISREEVAALHEKLQQLMAWIEWPLSHLLALTFFLSGSFDDALKGWQNQQAYKACNDKLIQGNKIQQGNQLVLLSTGCAAMSHDVQDEGHNDTAYVQAARGMLSRSLIIWCAVIAVLTLIGVLR